MNTGILVHGKSVKTCCHDQDEKVCLVVTPKIHATPRQEGLLILHYMACRVSAGTLLFLRSSFLIQGYTVRVPSSVRINRNVKEAYQRLPDWMKGYFNWHRDQ